MANRRFLHRFSVFWLGLTVICLLGHYIVDTISLGCQINTTYICQSEENQSNIATLSDSLLHAGFSLPSIDFIDSGLAFSFAPLIFILFPVTVTYPPLFPPPR